MKYSLLFAISIFTFKAFAVDCEGVEVAKILDGMRDVGQIYNCKMEVVRMDTFREVDGKEVAMNSYLVYGKDLFRCKTTDRVCPEANFEISIPKKCMNQEAVGSGQFSYSSAYNIDHQKVRNHIKIVKSDKQLQNLSFGQTELVGAQRLNYVQCQLDILGDE